MKKSEDIDTEFDERPSALLAHELRFGFFKSMLTASFTVIGGLVVLKGAFIPDAPLSSTFLLSIVAIFLGGALAYEGQLRVVRRLERRTVKPSWYEKSLFWSTPSLIFLGLGMQLSYFVEFLNITSGS